jgi:AAA-like domain
MQEKKLQIVLVATSDLKRECSAAAALIEELNRSTAGPRGLPLDLYWWYTDVHEQFHAEAAQSSPEPVPGVQSCDILIGVFWKGFTLGQAVGVSAPEREISGAYSSFKKLQKPEIFIYFREPANISETPEEVNRLNAIKKFQRNFPKNEFWGAYTTEAEFDKLVRQRLLHFIIATAQPPAPSASPLHRLYDFTKPVSDPRMFTGRHELRDEILQGARRGDSYAVIGGTRSGKTSLLFEVKRILLEELGNQSAYVVGPVFLSTHQFPKLSQTAIYREIILNFKSTILSLRFPNLQLEDGRLFDPEITDDKAFPAFQQVLETIVKTVSQDLRIVIMIDELDELQRHEWSKTFFNNLRHLISQSTLQRNISMIIAGTLAIYSLYNVAGSPFLNVISGTKKLRLLSFEEASQLINQPTGGQLTQAITHKIYLQTGGHPFLIQYIMKNLCDDSSGSLAHTTVEDIDRIVDKFLQERQDFSNWASKFKANDKAAYALIASRGEPVRKAELVQNLGNAEAANDSIELLAHLGLIRETQRNLFENGGLMFKTWFGDHFEPNDRVHRTEAP